MTAGPVLSCALLTGVMSASGTDHAALGVLRRLIVAVLLLGMTGTVVELLLIGHHEDPNQYASLVLLAVGFAVLAWQAAGGGAAAVRALQATMALFILSAAVGIVLHYRANMEFQLDIDPSIGALELFWKVMRAKMPPALAPGVMAQLGLIGLAYTYRHPALARRFDIGD